MPTVESECVELTSTCLLIHIFQKMKSYVLSGNLRIFFPKFSNFDVRIYIHGVVFFSKPLNSGAEESY